MLKEKSVKYGESIATNAEFSVRNKGLEETIKKSKEAIRQKRATGQKPVGLFILCGREFRIMSLKFHLKFCKQKFDLAQQSLLPNKRRNADKIIGNYEANQSRWVGGGNYDALNQQAFEQYKSRRPILWKNFSSR